MASGLMAIFGSTTGGLTTELGSGIVSGCLTMPGSATGGVGSGFGCSPWDCPGGAGADSGAGMISAASADVADRAAAKTITGLIRSISHASSTGIASATGVFPCRQKDVDPTFGRTVEEVQV